MAGSLFAERITPYLRGKIDELKEQFGEDSPQCRGLARQYVRSEQEDTELSEQNVKHYEAAVDVSTGEEELPGLERLYRRCLVIEPTLACVANCRYCLRGNYPKHTMTEKQLVDVAKYCGNDRNRENLNEVLITGGDPLLVPHRVEVLLNALIDYAPNIRTIRLATRVTAQDPARVDESVLRLFQNKPSLRFELATQISHPIEFFPEVVAVFKSIRDLGVKIYSQNVLLKGVNDNLETLVELYDLMRQNDIEPHYLFHPVPLTGTHHFRPTVDKGIRLAHALTSSGRISGRAKPMFAAMTDIGKITFYEGSIADRKDRLLLLRTYYKLEDRLAWNPSWQLPKTAEVDDDGYLQVWYLDGED